MIFFLVFDALITPYYSVFCKNCKKKDNELSVSHKSFKSNTNKKYLQNNEEIPENKERITINILFYPENEEQKEIRVKSATQVMVGTPITRTGFLSKGEIKPK